MRAKKAIVVRGAGGTDRLPERQEAYAEAFGGESDALGPGTEISRAKILSVLTPSVVRPVCPSGKIVRNVMPDPASSHRN